MLANIARLMKSWDESATYESVAGLKTTHAQVKYELSEGGLGTSVLDYSMVYASDTKTYFTGYEMVCGTLGDLEGAFVLLHEGIFDNGSVEISVTVVAGSGRGGLTGISGSGSINSDKENPMVSHMKLEYTLAKGV